MGNCLPTTYSILSLKSDDMLYVCLISSICTWFQRQLLYMRYHQPLTYRSELVFQWTRFPADFLTLEFGIKKVDWWLDGFVDDQWKGKYEIQILMQVLNCSKTMQNIWVLLCFICLNNLLSSQVVLNKELLQWRT